MNDYIESSEPVNHNFEEGDICEKCDGVAEGYISFYRGLDFGQNKVYCPCRYLFKITGPIRDGRESVTVIKRSKSQ